MRGVRARPNEQKSHMKKRSVLVRQIEIGVGIEFGVATEMAMEAGAAAELDAGIETGSGSFGP